MQSLLAQKRGVRRQSLSVMMQWRWGLIRRFIRRDFVSRDDIAVVGYDDIELAKYMTPPLTTIHQPKDELGELAIDVFDPSYRPARTATAAAAAYSCSDGTGLGLGLCRSFMRF
ncbi:Ribose operon repressor [Leclercia adecarboxylata]|uniref:Ribose operon repressor n=1 Tax=Leclercia adecarboxylata TaxID=83655 RepID=A0A4U9J093_9ENTR|nr:Ribose operon repressor [Leclercia adecarboxylata]